MANLILIIDDDPAVRSRLATGFVTRGFRVETAANGREALALLEGERPALVLVDLEMPVMDGRSFARELSARGLQLPLVLLSDEQEARGTAAEIGAAGYLSKPHAGPGQNGSSGQAV